MATDPTLIVNLTRGNIACEQAVMADRPLRRMRGLLGRRELPAGDGIFLRPAPSIHTAFMRFPIDVVFVDRDLRVVKVVEEMPAWRMASSRQARSALELAAGEVGCRGIAVGDRLAFLRTTTGASTGDDQMVGHAAGIAGDGTTPAGGRAEATRVLLVGSDRRFRSLAALMLTRRGCAVTLGAVAGAELSGLADVDVVVLDAGTSLTRAAREAAQIERADSQVGIVVVGERPDDDLSAMSVLAKWGDFDDLHAAIERARRPVGARRSVNAAL